MHQPSSHWHVRIARPVSDISRTQRMYCDGLGLEVLDSFKDHDGFDGVMLGHAGAQYHLEFTHGHRHPVAPTPTAEDLTVFYIPDVLEWQRACARMIASGFNAVPSLNPFWEIQGRTFEDADGYRVVLQNAPWGNVL